MREREREREREIERGGGREKDRKIRERWGMRYEFKLNPRI